MWVSAEDERYRTRAVVDYDLAPDNLQGELERVLAVAATRWRVGRATVTVVQGDRQFFPARLGMPEAQTSRAASICALTVACGALLLAPDTLADPRLADHPAVTGPPGVRFYAGAPLRLAPELPALGALCVLDVKPKREVGAADIALLTDLAGLVVHKLIERRRWLDPWRSREDRCWVD